MQFETDWFQLLFEHTNRQATMATVQILVSVFVLGFVWKDKTPLRAVYVMFLVYGICAGYLIYSLYKIQDRRLTLWKYIAIAEFGQLPDGNKLTPNSDNQDANDKESDKKKFREDYIKKLRPDTKRTVLIQHIIVSFFALMFILGSAKKKRTIKKKRNSNTAGKEPKNKTTV